MQREKKKRKGVKNRAVWRKTGQPELYDRILNGSPTDNDKLPGIGGISPEERFYQDSLADCEDSDTALNRQSSGKRHSNSELENGLDQNRRLESRNSDPAGLAVSQNGNNKLDLKNGMGESHEGHLPKIKDSRNWQKIEKVADGKKKREASLKGADASEIPLKKLVPMQNKGKSQEKATKKNSLNQDRLDDSFSAKRKEYIKFELTKDRGDGAFDASIQRKLLAELDNEKTEQRALASPTSPLSRNQSNSQSGMARSSPGRKLGLPTPTSRGSVNSDMWFSDMRPSTDQSGDISNWLRGETEDPSRRRTRSSSVGITSSRKQFYNEVYCMEKLKLTRGHTFSFFSLHPSYQEENKLLRSGIKLATILQFVPKVIKHREKEDEETMTDPITVKPENEEVLNKTVDTEHKGTD